MFFFSFLEAAVVLVEPVDEHDSVCVTHFFCLSLLGAAHDTQIYQTNILNLSSQRTRVTRVNSCHVSLAPMLVQTVRVWSPPIAYFGMAITAS